MNVKVNIIPTPQNVQLMSRMLSCFVWLRKLRSCIQR